MLNMAPIQMEVVHFILKNQFFDRDKLEKLFVLKKYLFIYYLKCYNYNIIFIIVIIT